MKRFALLFVLAAALSACVPVISSEYLQKAVTDAGFGQVRENPEAYINSIFILGGTIAGTEDTGSGTEMEVIQNPINSYGEITDPDMSDGRFLLTTRKQLDPLIFSKGRMITVAARLTGETTRTRDEREYGYPIFEAKEIYLWKTARYLPYSYLNPYFSPFYYYNYPYYWDDPFFRNPYVYPWP